jgi:hypothetical protein
MNKTNERQAIDVNRSNHDNNVFTRIYENNKRDNDDVETKRLKRERILNTDMATGFKNFIRNNRLQESEKGDKKIGIRDPQDAIFGIHYLADYLGKYILAGDIIDFDKIYYESMDKIENEKGINRQPSPL